MFIGTLYQQTDQFRRQLGGALDTVGLGPLATPSRTLVAEPCGTLKAYPSAPGDAGPPVLLIPAPIKRAYIWDLAPGASVVSRLIGAGLRPYLLQWEPPGETERGFGLTDYADRLVRHGVDAIAADTGHPSVALAGHSLGGTLAALFAALYPERVKGLILLGAPLHFGRGVGIFGALVAGAPPARQLMTAFGNVPGSVLNEICGLAAPVTFGWARWLDLLGSLADPRQLRTHLLVERWTLDELALPQRLFEEVVELLYREDRFMRGTLRIGDKSARPDQVTAPLLSVVDRRCVIAPPAAVTPFHRAVASTDKGLLWYDGDTGVAFQHVGMLVGRNAHQRLWPAIIRWVWAHTGRA